MSVGWYILQPSRGGTARGAPKGLGRDLRDVEMDGRGEKTAQ